MKNPTGLLLFMLMVILGSAFGADQRTHGYLHSQYGSVWRDSQGQCVWTTYWAVDVPECEPAMEPAVTEQAQPLAEPQLLLESVVQFDFDRADLKTLARTELDRLTKGIAQHEIRHIEIDGHTCSIGSDIYNQGLSERRAASVRRYLLDRGVEDGMIVSHGYGEKNPAHSNESREGRRLNRRAELRVFGIADK